MGQLHNMEKVFQTNFQHNGLCFKMKRIEDLIPLIVLNEPNNLD